MALFSTRSAAGYGIDTHLIDVEVDTYPGANRDYRTVGTTNLAPASNRVASVDLLRSVAFFIVFAFHFAGMMGPTFPPDGPARAFCAVMLRYGSFGTDLFFILSGFLFCRALSAGESWREAIGKRFARIYPGFLVVLAFYLALSPFATKVDKIPSGSLEALLYVAANVLLLPGIFPITPIVTVTWSLSYVAFGYGMFGLLYRVAGLRLQPDWYRAAIWTLLSVTTALLATYAGFPHGRLMYLFMGGLFVEILPRWRRLPVFIRAASLPLGLVLLGYATNFAVQAVGFALTAAVATLSDRLSRLAARVPASQLARASYAAFLTHGFVLRGVLWANPHTDGFPAFLALLLGTSALVLVVAFATNVMIFEPLTQACRARFARPPSKSDQPEADLGSIAPSRHWFPAFQRGPVVGIAAMRVTNPARH